MFATAPEAMVACWFPRLSELKSTTALDDEPITVIPPVNVSVSPPLNCKEAGAFTVKDANVPEALVPVSKP
jgi:hypothetical protein